MVRDHLLLARHRKDAVWRGLQSGSTLLARVAGARKTWTMAAAAMEMRRSAGTRNGKYAVRTFCAGRVLPVLPAKVEAIEPDDDGTGRDLALDGQLRSAHPPEVKGGRPGVGHGSGSPPKLLIHHG